MKEIKLWLEENLDAWDLERAKLEMAKERNAHVNPNLKRAFFVHALYDAFDWGHSDEGFSYWFLTVQKKFKERAKLRSTDDWLIAYLTEKEYVAACGYVRDQAKPGMHVLLNMRPSFKSALINAFVFDLTREGGQYWDEVSDRTIETPQEYD